MKAADAADRLPGGFDGGFTVLMAVYQGDSPQKFQRAIDSVFANTLPPDRMVLIVDGPIPKELEARVEALRQSHPRVLVSRLEENRGLAAALNAGLALVETEWVVRADPDDINRADRFARQAAALTAAEPPLDLLGGAIQEMDVDGTPLAIRRTAEGALQIRRFARRRNPFNHMTVAYRAALVRQVGGYPNVHLKEDYALWASLLHVGARSDNLADILVEATAGRDLYRRRGGLRYAAAEIRLQQHLAHCGLKTWPQALADGLARSTVFLLPSSLRALVYRLYLRG